MPQKPTNENLERRNRVAHNLKAYPLTNAAAFSFAVTLTVVVGLSGAALIQKQWGGDSVAATAVPLVLSILIARFILRRANSWLVSVGLAVGAAAMLFFLKNDVLGGDAALIAAIPCALSRILYEFFLKKEGASTRI